MKWLSAGLTFVNVTTVCGLLEGIASHGLSKTVAISSAVAGLVAALLAYWGTCDSPAREEAPDVTHSTVVAPASRRYRSIWLWLMVAIFAIFAFRSFCNVLFIDGNELKIQNPNNLGDLSLHLTYIKNFASGVALWPENPIYVFSKLRYPAGIDLFNALLVCLDIDVIRGLVWVGLLASAATFVTRFIAGAERLPLPVSSSTAAWPVFNGSRTFSGTITRAFLLSAGKALLCQCSSRSAGCSTPCPSVSFCFTIGARNFSREPKRPGRRSRPRRPSRFGWS